MTKLNISIDKKIMNKETLKHVGHQEFDINNRKGSNVFKNKKKYSRKLKHNKGWSNEI